MPELKTRRDLKRLWFNKGNGEKPTRIGGHAVGDVYIGTAVFKDGKRHRVAIKVFKDGMPLKKAMAYQKTISELRKAGVRLPKMAMVKMPTEERPKGEWVQVSELYGSTKKGSKIENKSLSLEGEKNREEAIRLLTGVANAGFFPSMDIIEPRKDGKGVYAIDVDMAVEVGKYPSAGQATELMRQIRAMTMSKKERRKLFETAFEAAAPKIKKAMKKMRESPWGLEFFGKA